MATVTLNRPEQLNALNEEMYPALTGKMLRSMYQDRWNRKNNRVETAT